MKKIKLEVGKTYRNRKGKEVKIVEKDNTVNYPCLSSNGERYTESGKWSYVSEEHPKDLIEEVTISDASQKRNKMGQIKLEVGKTYRSREGKEVKIVGNNSVSDYLYQGNNGHWYTESGGWGWDSEHPGDLIEEVKEVPNIRHTFDIPDGVKTITIEQVGNRIVVEMVPEKEPKPGDVMINKDRSVYIFKGVVDDHNHEHYAWLGTSGRLAINTNTMCNPGRPATPEEAQPLWDALKKAGKRWNPVTQVVEEITEIDHIREWVEMNIKDGYYNHEDVAEVIEAYLKHKEGGK